MKLLQRFKAFILCCLILIYIAPACAQKYDLDWVNAIGGKWYESITSIASDGNNSIYSVGNFVDSLDFDPGSNVMHLPVIYNNEQSSFIYKTDASGLPIWVKKFSNLSGQTIGNPTITIDSFNNLYITGAFGGTIDFDPGSDTFSLTAQGYGGSDIFIVKLDSAGNFIWAKNINGGDSYVNSNDIVYKDGYIYIVGTIGEVYDSIDFDPDPVSVFKFMPPGLNNAYVLKMDTMGKYVWAKVLSGVDLFGDQVTGIAITADNDGNVAVTGNYNGTIDFDPGDEEHVLTNKYKRNIYVLKLNNSGNFIWVKEGIGKGYDEPRDITTDMHNDIYVIGYFNLNYTGSVVYFDTIDFDPGPDRYDLISNNQGDAFILKLRASGNFGWAKQLGGQSFDQGTSISVSKLGVVYTSFSTKMSGTIPNRPEVVDFDPNSGVFNIAAPIAGALHLGMCFLDTSGKFLWGGILGNGGNQAAEPYERISITHDLLGNVYLGGYYRTQTRELDTVDFDPGSNIEMVNYAGGDDIFLLKLSPCIIRNTVTAQGCDNYVSRGNTYVESGIFADTSTRTPGICDSIFTLNLMLNYGTIDTLIVTRCDSFSYNGQNYTTDGFYTHNFITSKDCDSIIVVNLVITGVTPDTAVSQFGTTLSSLAFGATYQWLDCGNGNIPVKGATNARFTPTQNGSYAVVVTGSGGCTDTSYCYTVTDLTDINDPVMENSIYMYPNPAQEQITIETQQALQNGIMRISTMQGQVLLQQYELRGRQFYADIRPFATGIYILEISDGSRMTKFKLIKK